MKTIRRLFAAIALAASGLVAPAKAASYSTDQRRAGSKMIGLRSLIRRTLAATVLSAAVLLGVLGGAGSAGAQTQTAVEYYYGLWNFYFLTAFPNEIAALDGGAFGGAWQRTGQTFDVWTGPTNGALPTCRFFSTIFTPKSAHFYTPYADECASLKAGQGWQYEAIAFYLQLPDANGNCPTGTEVLYRLYNNGMGGAPNHRFTRSAALFNQMRAAGWVFEGNGLTGAFACVPASPPPAPTAEGRWFGSRSDGQNIVGYILDTGAYYFFYYPTNNPLSGVIQGTGRSVNGAFFSSDAFDFQFAPGTPFGGVPATVIGSYTARSALSGTVNEGAGSVGFNTIYSSLYEQPVTLASSAGTYLAPPAGNVTIDATGAVTGSSSTGCTFSGTAVPRGGVGVLDLTLTFGGGGGAGCALGTSTLRGIAFFFDATHTQLVLFISNPENAAYYFVGNK